VRLTEWISSRANQARMMSTRSTFCQSLCSLYGILEREIDSFASQWALTPRFGTTEMKQVGLDEQLALIETKAAALRR
jgi:hypothetical protein